MSYLAFPNSGIYPGTIIPITGGGFSVATVTYGLNPLHGLKSFDPKQQAALEKVLKLPFPADASDGLKNYLRKQNPAHAVWSFAQVIPPDMFKRIYDGEAGMLDAIVATLGFQAGTEILGKLPLQERMEVWNLHFAEKTRKLIRKEVGTADRLNGILYSEILAKARKDFDGLGSPAQQKEITKLTKIVNKAKDVLADQQASMEKVTAAPWAHATVLGFKDVEVPQSMILYGNPQGVPLTPDKVKKGIRVALRTDSTFFGRKGQGAGKGGKLVDFNEDMLNETKDLYVEEVERTQQPYIVVEWDNSDRGVYTIADLALEDIGAAIHSKDFLKKRIEKMVTVLHGGQPIDVYWPRHIVTGSMQIGQTVMIHTASSQIIQVTDTMNFGVTIKVQSIVSADTIMVQMQDQKKTVMAGMFAGKIKEHDQVILDASGSVVLKHLGPEQPKQQKSRVTGVHWDDIGGLADAKRSLIEAIELPNKYPEIFEYYQKERSKGVLLYGPPGCGKTLLAKAVATSLSEMHDGKGADSAFQYVKGPEILNMYVGQSEQNVREIFNQARAHFEKYGFPQVIFIDEADAIMGKRGGDQGSRMSGTVVPAFLTEMDGLDASGAIILLATNRPDVLDPAVVRDGRISKKIRVTRPNAHDAAQILALYLRSIPLTAPLTEETATKLAMKQLFSKDAALYEITLKDNTVHPFTLGHLASGAMLAAVIENAKSLALHRDLKDGTRTGLGAQDITTAITEMANENRDLDHKDDLDQFSEPYKGKVMAIKKVPHGHGK